MVKELASNHFSPLFLYLQMRIALIWIAVANWLLLLSVTVSEMNTIMSKDVETYENYQIDSNTQSILDTNFVDKNNPSIFGSYLSFANKVRELDKFLKPILDWYYGLPKFWSNEGKRSIIKKKNKLEILTAIKSLQSYKSNSLRANKRRRNLFKSISKKQQQIADDIGYLRKLLKVDELIEKNQDFLTNIAKYFIEKYEIRDEEFNILNKDELTNNSPSKANFRVVEALGHYFRDWSHESNKELDLILKYVTEELINIIPVEDREKTAVIVPGSGLGRVAHEIAEIGKNEVRFGSVHAVEYSGIMHICNEFIYSNKLKQKYFPFIHSYSNHMNDSTQIRSYYVDPQVPKPPNLYLHHDDFLLFEIPKLIKFENVVVVSVFFIDTASNMLDYFDRIKYFCTIDGIQNGYWINVGPLKYGSAPKVEFNFEEVNEIKKLTGWKDINRIETTNHEKFKNKFVGYMTDTMSLWQAFYSLCMWTSARIENIKD